MPQCSFAFAKLRQVKPANNSPTTSPPNPLVDYSLSSADFSVPSPTSPSASPLSAAMDSWYISVPLAGSPWVMPSYYSLTAKSGSEILKLDSGIEILGSDLDSDLEPVAELGLGLGLQLDAEQRYCGLSVWWKSVACELAAYSLLPLWAPSSARLEACEQVRLGE